MIEEDSPSTDDGLRLPGSDYHIVGLGLLSDVVALLKFPLFLENSKGFVL